MKIDELLYHLHHSASIPEIDASELNLLLKKYPYLESLRLAISQNPDTPSQTNHDVDLQNRFLQLAAKAYDYDHSGNILPPPVFDVPTPVQPLSPESDRLSPSLTAVTSEDEFHLGTPLSNSDQLALMTQGALTSNQDVINDENPPFRLYPYEPSDFIKFLQRLPACRVHPLDEVAIDKKENTAITDEYISSSIDLQSGVSSESLANLWASQGKYEASIKIYENLIRENPEKSSIFAAKIAKLKAENSL